MNALRITLLVLSACHSEHEHKDTAPQIDAVEPVADAGPDQYVEVGEPITLSIGIALARHLWDFDWLNR